jgi:hypothetical protein
MGYEKKLLSDSKKITKLDEKLFMFLREEIKVKLITEGNLRNFNNVIIDD